MRFVNKFRGYYLIKYKVFRASVNFYECCYKFLPRAGLKIKSIPYNSALQAFSIFCSSTLTHNNIGFNFRLFLKSSCLENILKRYSNTKMAMISEGDSQN
ncbi:hypothetical protein ACLK19_17655 [Escherichia coli]